MTVAAAVSNAHRSEWGSVLAATVRLTRDIDLAEECVQDSYLRALTTWERDGIPRNPGAWLSVVARNCALDALRRNNTQRAKLPLLVSDDSYDSELAEVSDMPDDRLRLIFTCCHPALALEAQCALTLRLLCGLTTAEVARAFLVPDATMAARITRAKKKIAAARIPYRVPPLAELPVRIDAVLTVVELLFSTGHTAPSGQTLTRNDLIDTALQLARLLNALLPNNSDVEGLLSLILLTDARRPARVGADGKLCTLSKQDRTLWNQRMISEGITLVRKSLRGRPPGRYPLMAAIAAVHDEAATWADTDFDEIAALYGVLMTVWPTPVVALNHAIAVGHADGPAAGLALLDSLSSEPALAGYQYLSAARANFLDRLGRTDDARLAYREALLLTTNSVEQQFLSESSSPSGA